MKRYNKFTFLFLSITLCSLYMCAPDNAPGKNGFTKVDTEESGFDFTNLLDERNLKSAFNYINVYLGGGVAIGDINNDGLQDIYMLSLIHI